MAQETINLGTGNNTGDGEGLRDGGLKINANFTELYGLFTSMAAAGYSGNATATVVSVAGTYYVVAGTLVESFTTSDMTTNAAGRLTYNGATPKHFHIVSNFDMTTSASNQILSFQWYKNNTPISPPVKRKVGTSSDIGAASLHADTMMSAGDFVELKVTDDTSTTNVIVENLYLFVMGMITP